MNSLFIVILAVSIFWIGYKFYAKRIENIFKPDPDKKTPAHFKYDGVDYVPAKHWLILFGHHFASIAGAAPIIGPILAVSIWGWAPTLIWIVLGTVFIGGVHDFASLMASARHGGSSIADFSQQVISKNTKYIFLTFLWVTLILIISVFVEACAKTLVVKPEIVIPSLGLIPLAILVGYLLYVKKLNQVFVTVLGLFGLAALILWGSKAPVAVPGDAIKIWSVVLLVYAFCASVMPVHILLQPRDYLSAFLLVLGLVFGYVGILVSQPKMAFPAYINWGPTAGMALWPVLFVTVACGAISGFHSIVASGTTSKQLPNEIYAKRIGYGSMVAEGLLATMALLVVAVAYSQTGILKNVITAGGGPVSAFGFGYGKVTESFLGKFGVLFAVLILNAFILTTLDTATRICRYLTQELFRVKNRYLTTIVVIALSGWLSLKGELGKIWPIFGSANQLIAALTLIVITSWFLSTGKKIRYTFIPTIFMLATATGALIVKGIQYYKEKTYILVVIAVVLLILAGFILFEAVWSVMKTRKRSNGDPSHSFGI